MLTKTFQNDEERSPLVLRRVATRAGFGLADALIFGMRFYAFGPAYRALYERHSFYVARGNRQASFVVVVWRYSLFG